MKAVISHGSIPEKVQNGVSFPFSEAFIRSFDPQNSEKLSKYPIIIIDAAKKYECAFLHPCNGINFTAQVRSLSLGHVAHQAKNDHIMGWRTTGIKLFPSLPTSTMFLVMKTRNLQ